MLLKNRKLVLTGALLLPAALLSFDLAQPPGEQWGAQSGIALIRVYQKQVRPVTRPFVRCRLHPSCSEFGVKALQQRGLPGVLDIGERLVMCELARQDQAGRAAARTQGGFGDSSTSSPRILMASTAPLPAMTLLQRRRRSNDDVAGSLACGGAVFFFLMLFALGIAILVWVARDAKNRGVDSPVLWMLLVLFTNVLGLIIYILARPGGNLVRCEQCRGRKLQHAKLCPHCGNTDPRIQTPSAG